MTQPAFRLATRAQTLKASEIRELLKLVGKPSMISFAGGIPDPALFNLAAFQAACHEAFGGPQVAREALQYSTTEGYAPLRQWLASHMQSQGVPATADNILITTGSQQALDLIGKLLIDPGSAVVTARPTYLGAVQAFSAYQARFAALDTPHPLGDDAPRLLYLVPDFANPTGLTMSRNARQQALEQARALNAIIVEDAAYSALRYDGEALPAIAALDAANGSIEATRTLYCGTFSKTLSPGLRIGWVCGPTALIRKLAMLKQSADLHTSTVNQMVMHHVATSSYDAQVTAIRSVYRTRRDAMLAALERYAPTAVRWKKPDGGMFIWLELPEHIDASALLSQAIREDIAFVPGGAFFPDGTGRNTLRLSFSLADEAQIELGIFKLCQLLGRQAMARAVNVH
ncbi:PLP-dependent aminotransferase family protein [Devosia neptuniae]|uniref:aminotransferase-like domain-containing protein n=2 Tax=Devosia TaxID=46913 RepID=UPI0022AEAFDC|nr:PLP-dependent aminotransferase family protein [Devosia neptuniae]MCZ4347081.1 PLP-dependent aminotransferase family protein [Devosia neptuniae]|tara:strand:- start:46260 stop:47462 length:1203 start_codon:yes stop_codon:yes gene_type:complete